MKLRETGLDGLLVVEQERLSDERGFFARTFDAEVLGPVVQMSTSFNRIRGTLRGMHYQRAPHGERKLVRCTRGRIYDVAVDLVTRRWFGIELSEANGLAVSIPREHAHGFLTLEPDSEVLYAMDAPYVADAATGVRWDDPAFAIDWPAPPDVVSDRDAHWPLVGE